MDLDKGISALQLLQTTVPEIFAGLIGLFQLLAGVWAKQAPPAPQATPEQHARIGAICGGPLVDIVVSALVSEAVQTLIKALVNSFASPAQKVACGL